MADALPPLLAGNEQPLHFFNIAGGTAIDSLNALILLRREQPRLLDGRAVCIKVLDRDSEGPGFGARALAALESEGGPLQHVNATFCRIGYDWARAGDLAPVLADTRAQGAIAIGSSEGGLFEYGSDDEIVSNLTALRDGAPRGFVMVGSVTRADAPIQRLRQASPAATRMRGLDVFAALAASAGWTVSRAIERPFSDSVVLRPDA
jgi:hypothetical protein